MLKRIKAFFASAKEELDGSAQQRRDDERAHHEFRAQNPAEVAAAAARIGRKADAEGVATLLFGSGHLPFYNEVISKLHERGYRLSGGGCTWYVYPRPGTEFPQTGSRHE